ncbi:MCE family protein [Pontibacter sp. KCTC 32443]|uniref:MlaD family protein n=1 Tax=Pontibacter TaxID=323449 RepID=UPI00164E4511|nr:MULTISPECIES: MlaD family protein [Pontibacter]MBC5774957.1 MCE family protein [Pontibacter sp. KCTC 32443]
MSTEDNKRSIIVGIFVLLALIILIAGIFTLGGQQKRFISTVAVKAVFDDVAGLKTGNNVWFSGVKIGTIKTINLYGDSQVEVIMNIEKNAQQYIHKDAVARISSESFIGNKNIIIESGSPQAPVIEDGDRITAVNPLNTDDLMETLQQNNKNLVAITGDFKQLSSKLVNGEGTIGAILTDTAMAQNFRAMVANLQRVSQNTMRASNDLNRFTAQLNTPGSLASELLTDTTVYNQLQASMTQLKQATTSAATLTQNLQKASNNINNQNSALGVLLTDKEFARNLQTTMQNLETSTQKFDQNMEALQSNFLLRGFFKKQAKEQEKQNGQQPAQQDTTKL